MSSPMSWPACAGWRISTSLRIDISASSPDTLALQEPCLDQVGDDPLDGPLGDADHLCHISEPHVRVTRDAQKHLRAICEEPPGTSIIVDLTYTKKLSYYLSRVRSIAPSRSYVPTIARKGAAMSASEWAAADLIQSIERVGTETTVTLSGELDVSTIAKVSDLLEHECAKAVADPTRPRGRRVRGFVSSPCVRRRQQAARSARHRLPANLGREQRDQAHVRDRTSSTGSSFRTRADAENGNGNGRPQAHSA